MYACMYIQNLWTTLYPNAAGLDPRATEVGCGVDACVGVCAGGGRGGSAKGAV